MQYFYLYFFCFIINFAQFPFCFTTTPRSGQSPPLPSRRLLRHAPVEPGSKTFLQVIPTGHPVMLVPAAQADFVRQGIPRHHPGCAGAWTLHPPAGRRLAGHQQDFIRRAIPGSRLVTIKNAHHGTNLDNPKQVQKEINTHISSYI